MYSYAVFTQKIADFRDFQGFFDKKPHFYRKSNKKMNF